jgi:hypothetical protein
MLIGHVFISRMMRSLWRTISDEYPLEAENRRRFECHPMMVGMLERALYAASWQVGRPEFVLVWLALKVSGQWKWSDDLPTRPARAVLNLFLIGNGFSLAYAIVGAKLVEFLDHRDTMAAIALPSAVVIVTVWFWIWARLSRPASHLITAP